MVDDPANKVYPMPLTATQQWDVEVGRIRENDVFDDRGLDLFVSGDQVDSIIEFVESTRKGDILSNVLCFHVSVVARSGVECSYHCGDDVDLTYQMRC